MAQQKVADKDMDDYNKYNIYRTDRQMRKGGGVMLLVDSTIRSDHKENLEVNSKVQNEIITIEIEPTIGNTYIIIVAYRSRKDPIPIFLTLNKP